MSTRNVSLSTAYRPELQIQEYPFLIASDEGMLNPASVANQDFFWLNDAKRQLGEIRQEVSEACTLDSEIDPVPDAAYRDAHLLIEFLSNYNVPTPDIGWLMDGGIGFEWRAQNIKGIATISIYGDNKVVYGASSKETKVKGTCTLTGLTSLVHLTSKFIDFMRFIKELV